MRAWQGNAVFMAAGPMVAGILLFAPTGTNAEVWRINNVDNAVSIHLRQKPSNRSKVLAYIPVAATGIKGGACQGEWCPIEFRGFNGYVFKKYLMPDDEGTKTPVETVASAPASGTDTASEDLPKVLAVAANNGAPVPIYAFPNENLPLAGHLPQGTTSVERVGPCIRDWCNIRAGELSGWLRDSALMRPNSGAAATPSDGREARALNTTENTATQADADVPDSPTASPAEGNKLYSLAGLSSSALAMREKPEDGAPIVAFVPANAKDIEGLHKCTRKWCLVRRDGASGWVERRHLADESVEFSRHFQVNGWKAVEVYDQPGAAAEVVGRIPAYATGIVPIGGCDKTWCHVRYLGVAGWVSASSLAPLARH